MRNRGFTFIEVAIAAAIMTVVAGVGMSLMMTGTRVYAQGSKRTNASTRATAIMDRILSELRMASIVAEDLNRNDDPDDLVREDTNGNGRVEDDWSLADGATASEITFNAVRGLKIYSEPIRFFFDGERVYREFGATSPDKAVLARDVTALTFTRRGRLVLIHLVVQAGEVGKHETGAEKDGSQVSLVREVLLRN